MASNKFFTIMIVPEKTQKVKKLILPAYLVRGAAIALACMVVLAIIMILDYANVMGQIAENKRLKVENRQLRQAVHIFKDKITTVEGTLDRVKTFATKLRIITNIEEQPQSSPNVPAGGSTPIDAPAGSSDHTSTAPTQPSQPLQAITSNPAEDESKKLKQSFSSSGLEADTDEEFMNLAAQMPHTMDPDVQRAKRKALIAALTKDSSSALTLSDADTSIFVKEEFEKLDDAYEEVNRFALEQEQEAQYIMEKLGEKRALIAGTPTRLPTLGYITSEYGVRISPYDSRRKMHEGIDIANRHGADVIAPANGVVMFSGNKPGYGRVVVVDHGNGIETYFAHLSRAFVGEGTRVKRGQRIAAVGSSGHSTGPHLHYEIRANGLPVDPCWYILDQSTVCRSR